MDDLDFGRDCLAASFQSSLSITNEREEEMRNDGMSDREEYYRIIGLRTVTYYWSHLANSRSYAALVPSSNQAHGYKLIYPD